MIKDWILNLPWDKIKEASDDFKIDYRIIGAIVSVESNGNTFACRYEKNYKWVTELDHFANINHITKITETKLQKMSFGLMQIMGATARDVGFSGPLTKLCDPDEGLFYGCKYFRRLIDKYVNVQDAIAAYNAGSPRLDDCGNYINRDYVEKVRSRMEEISYGFH